MTAKYRVFEVTIIDLFGIQTVVNPELLATLEKPLRCEFEITKVVDSHLISTGFLKIYNLGTLKAAALDFREDPNGIKFGPRIKIRAGYTDEGVKTIFEGVVKRAQTYKSLPDYITEIELINDFYLVLNKPVTAIAVRGSTLAQLVIELIGKAGGKISAGQRSEINKNLGTVIYQSSEYIQTTLSTFFKQLEFGYPNSISFHYDDDGVVFIPVGKISESRFISTKVVSPLNGLIGSPKATEKGSSFNVKLDGAFRVYDICLVTSESLARFEFAPGGFAGTNRNLQQIIVELTHQGDNEDGPFETQVEAQFVENFAVVA